MKKLLIVCMFAAIQLVFSPGQAQALPSFSGTVNLTFAPGNSTTLDWFVYKPTDTGSLSGSSAGYTYQYTLNGWAGYDGLADVKVLTGVAGAASITSTGVASTGVPTAGIFAGVFGNYFEFNLLGPFGGPADLSNPANSITGWFTSTNAPVKTMASAQTASSVPINVGLGIDSQVIMATDQVPPGVPEPATWVLLLSLMAFATWWMRRTQDGDAPMESAIAA